MFSKKALAFSIFLFAIIASLNAQTLVVLTGRVIDKKTRQPVPYAHVGIPERGIGTSTGFDGRFEFKLPKELEAAAMTVSCMDYGTWKGTARTFQNGGNIQLEQDTRDLVEVVVMDQRAVEDIVRKAVANIEKNYPTKGYRMQGFYRESLTDDSLRHRYLAEGVLDIYNPGYDNRKKGQVGLVQGRKINLQNPLDTNVNAGFASGHMAAHRFDFVRNLEDFIDERYFPVYKYWIESVTTYDGRPVYVIGFAKDEDGVPKSAKKKKKRLNFLRNNDDEDTPSKYEALMKGRLFIEQESFAFVRAEFEYTREGIAQIGQYPLYVGNWAGNTYVVNYRKQGKKWHFSDALREGKRHKGGFYANDIVITEIKMGENEAIPYQQRLERGDEFVNLTGSYDPDFWRNYNTAPMSPALAESMMQYQSFQKAQEVFSDSFMVATQQKRDSVELQRLKERIAEVKGVEVAEIEPVDVISEKTRLQQQRDKFRRTNFGMGLGTHFTSTNSMPLGIRYADKDGETILDLSKDLKARDFEVIFRWEFDIYLHRMFFIRFGNAFDFYNSVYRDWAIGTGVQLNLTPKRRPIILRGVAQYDYLRYARMLGNTDNDYGKFRVDGERFKGESVRLSYGSRLHNLNVSAELSIELNRHRELYFRGTWHNTFASQQNVWFRERKQFSRKKERLPVDDSRLTVTSNDLPFSARITPKETLSFTVGLWFK